MENERREKVNKEKNGRKAKKGKRGEKKKENTNKKQRAIEANMRGKRENVGKG